MTRGLLIVDVQVDFCEGGALAVQGGAAVAKGTSELIALQYGSGTSYGHIFTSQDWHNPLPDLNGGHFAAEGEAPDFVNSWPVHCVAGTRGATLHPDLVLGWEGTPVTAIQKGQGRPDYSAFQGRNPNGLQLLSWELDALDITSLDVVGIATDYCVQASTLHALQFLASGRLQEVRVIVDLTAGVAEESTRAALLAMQEQGAKLVNARNV